MGIFDSLKKGLAKTKENFGNQVNKVFSTFRKVDEELLEELEEALILADVGFNTSAEIITRLRKEIKLNNLKDAEDVKVKLKEILINILEDLKSGNDYEEEFTPHDNNVKCILIVGVNGVGKTTSIGKLARIYKNKGKKVLIIPADTFRAAAVDQIKIWSERAGVDIAEATEGEDPSSVVYRALDSAKSENYDIIIIDTAGRLHNKKNLMTELDKIHRTIGKVRKDVTEETYLVLDGTTGQNAIEQSKAFNEISEISGYILTKLDGTSKGGVIVGIKGETQVPIKFIGVGEGIEDLEEFDANSFVSALLD